MHDTHGYARTLSAVVCSQSPMSVSVETKLSELLSNSGVFQNEVLNFKILICSVPPLGQN